MTDIYAGPRNLAAFTPPGGVMPSYISINTYAGKPGVVCVTVRSASEDNSTQATIEIPIKEFKVLVCDAFLNLKV